jgi:hypothetical protein
MLGTALLRLVQWFGPINSYLAFVALMIGVWAGVMWRLSPSGERARFTAAQRAGHFCRNCRWAVPDPGYRRTDDLEWSQARCMHPTSREYPARYLTIGVDRPSDMAFCEHARHRGRCGPRGRFWEPGPQLIGPAPAELISP